MKASLFAAALLVLCPPAARALEPDAYAAAMTEARSAYEAEDWPAAVAALDRAQSARPWSLYVYRNRILARWLAGDADEALRLADDAASKGLFLDLTGAPGFEAMTAAPQFADIAARMEANLTPAGGPGAPRDYAEADLLPEAIDLGDGALFVGAVRNGRIFKVDPSAEELTHVATAPGGVFDLEVRGDRLWAAVNNQLAYEESGKEAPFAAVMAFDADTGDLLREMRAAEGPALFGDLEFAANGAAYVSDSLTPRILRFSADGGAAETFAADARFANLQGLALDEKHKRLFVADYLTGLYVIDLRTGAATAIANEADAWLGGIDGLYLVKGALIAIQNGVTPQRIVRLDLNKDATAITALTVIQSNLAAWREPTHGVIVGDVLHYIATSNWPAYGDDGEPLEGATLEPLRIMTAPILPTSEDGRD